jgi:hypothetical protein
MSDTQTADRAVVLARMLRTVDQIIRDAKAIERDREELRRLTTPDAPQTPREVQR